MPSFVGSSSVDLERGSQDIPESCPLALLLPSAPVAPPEAPTLVEGAIVFDSCAAVISEDVVMTIRNASKNSQTDRFRKKEKPIRCYESTFRKGLTL